MATNCISYKLRLSLMLTTFRAYLIRWLAPTAFWLIEGFWHPHFRFRVLTFDKVIRFWWNLLKIVECATQVRLSRIINLHTSTAIWLVPCNNFCKSYRILMKFLRMFIIWICRQIQSAHINRFMICTLRGPCRPVTVLLTN